MFDVIIEQMQYFYRTLDGIFIFPGHRFSVLEFIITTVLLVAVLSIIGIRSGGDD